MGYIAIAASCVIYLIGAGATYEMDPTDQRAGEVARGLSRGWVTAFWPFFWTGRATVSIVTAPFNLGRRLARGSSVPTARALPPVADDEYAP